MPQQEPQLEDRHALDLERQSHQAATRVATEQDREKIKNPEFLAQLQDADVDSDLYDWVEDEFGPVFSGAHILGDRGEYYEEQQEFLNRNKVERMVAERKPGRLLRENPKLLALAQGFQGTREKPDPTDHPEFRTPISSRKRRVVRDAGEIATTRQTLAIGGRGVDAVATATVENRTVTNEQRDHNRAAEKAKEVFR